MADNVIKSQGAAHAEGHDYVKGSPHLRHSSLRDSVTLRLEDLVRHAIERKGSCRVIEVGGGHGTFTDVLRRAGAEVLVTETSRASASYLQRVFGMDPGVEIAYDETGEGVFADPRQWDVAVVISVLHHIPDYVEFVERLAEKIAPGGSFFSIQDPLYYPRMSFWAHAADRAAYLAWRIVQGDLGRGLATRVRRIRGIYDPNAAGDLVEYHVVRQGVDEEALRASLAKRFDDVELFTYWSTQAPLFQWLGERTSAKTTFGIEAHCPMVNTHLNK